MFRPDYIKLSVNPDILRTGADRINANFDAIASEIEAAIDGLSYQNSVIDILNIAPTSGITLGSRYIVSFGVLASDPWYGHIDDIAELVNDDPYEWSFYTPSAGWCCVVIEKDVEYIYNDEQWNAGAASTQHNSLSNIDGSTYHVSSDVYNALGGTGTPSDNNKFVTADTLSSDISTHDHSGVASAQIDYSDLENIPQSFTPSSHSHPKTDISDFSHSHSKTDVFDFAHTSSHISSGTDEIDGDKLDIDFNPSYYEPVAVLETTHLDHLSSHLGGIDSRFSGILTDISALESGSIESIDMTVIDCGQVSEAPAGIWLQFDTVDGGSFAS